MATSAVPPMPSQANQGPMINAVIWLGAGLSLILVLLRVFARARIVKKIGLDDHIMVVAMVSQYGTSSMSTVFNV